MSNKKFREVVTDAADLNGGEPLAGSGFEGEEPDHRFGPVVSAETEDR